MNYVGIDWAYRRAAWCALKVDGEIEGEGMIPADEDGLARLVLELGTQVKACVETKDSRGELLTLSDRLTVLHGIERPRQLPRTLCATSAEREMSSTQCTGSARRWVMLLA